MRENKANLVMKKLTLHDRILALSKARLETIEETAFALGISSGSIRAYKAHPEMQPRPKVLRKLAELEQHQLAALRPESSIAIAEEGPSLATIDDVERETTKALLNLAFATIKRIGKKAVYDLDVNLAELWALRGETAEEQEAHEMVSVIFDKERSNTAAQKETLKCLHEIAKGKVRPK